MTEQLPTPPVPAEVDLTDFSYMPLEVSRLRRSKAWLICKRRPELAFYMINLWTAAWHERPAGSLEDDDDVLANFAMCSPKDWKKLRAEIMRGWVKCTDGRLYHPVVIEKVRESWRSKMIHLYDKECGRLRKAWTRTKQAGVFVPPTFDEWDSTRMSVGNGWMSSGQRDDSDGHTPDFQGTSQQSPAENALKVREGKGREGNIRDMYVGHACPPDNLSSPTDEGTAEKSAADPEEVFRLIQTSYPKFTGRQDWLTAAHHFRLLIDRDRIPSTDLTAAVERYAAFVAAGGVSGPQYVMTPAKFFSAADKPWQQSWTPPPTKAEAKRDSNIDASLTWLADQEAKDAVR